MDIATIIGIFLGVGLVGTAMVQATVNLSGGILTFVEPASLMIVLGGTIAATAIAFPLAEVMRLVANLKAVFSGEKVKNALILEEIVEMAAVARKGTVDLEKSLGEAKTPFFKDGLQMIVDGLAEDDIRYILETRVDNRALREQAEANVFRTMGTMAPAFGMVGTLVGLVAMLYGMAQASAGAGGGKDPAAALGQAMGLALITTLYGALFANLLFNPIATKLKSRIEKRNISQNMIIEGVVLLKKKKHPLLVREHLNSFLPPKEWKREEV
ncbi:MAG: MotA/TolQ/ExbB proton channel family protein [Candidatus Marinimicrobia bacterium]|nr:MotA/TolQ/ExbB proton channel family protein [Candidatus Neomarinimicrobiota bacterium]MCF7839845.1 MotA/TolQ/ExbB proton channel family protein [Candidatus Neomarinimicrobiota bacterium]